MNQKDFEDFLDRKAALLTSITGHTFQRTTALPQLKLDLERLRAALQSRPNDAELRQSVQYFEDYIQQRESQAQ
jgi:hypothetical protein